MNSLKDDMVKEANDRQRLEIRLDQETSDLNSRCKIFSLFMNQTQNESQALKEKLSEEEIARQHKQREISEMLKLQQAKSLYISCAVSNFYETENEIWDGFGPLGNTEKKNLGHRECNF